jgi:hypothetical protein
MTSAQLGRHSDRNLHRDRTIDHLDGRVLVSTVDVEMTANRSTYV